MIVETRSDYFQLVYRTANVTDSSITTPLPTLTKPSGDGVLTFGDGGGATANGLQLVPYGAGSGTNTFTMAVYGWRQTEGAGGALPIWIPFTLATFTCTLATPPGLSGADVNASQLFCGTIAMVVGNANVSNEVVSPTGNTIAHVLVDTKGSKLVEVRFGTGSSATSCNALWAKV